MEERQGRPEVAPSLEYDVPLETLSIAVFRASGVERATSFYAALEKDCLPLRNVVMEEENPREAQNFFNTIQEVDQCQHKVYKGPRSASQPDDNSRREGWHTSDEVAAQGQRGISVTANTPTTDNTHGAQEREDESIVGPLLVLDSDSSDDDSSDEEQESDSRGIEGAAILDLDFPMEAMMGLVQNLVAMDTLNRAMAEQRSESGDRRSGPEGQRSGPGGQSSQPEAPPSQPDPPTITSPPETVGHPVVNPLGPMLQLLQSSLPPEQLGSLMAAGPNGPGNPSVEQGDNPFAFMADFIGGLQPQGSNPGPDGETSAEQPPNPLPFLSTLQGLFMQQAASTPETPDGDERLPTNPGQIPLNPIALLGNIRGGQQGETFPGDPLALFTSMLGGLQGQMPEDAEAEAETDVPSEEMRNEAEELPSREPARTEHTMRASPTSIEGGAPEAETVRVPQEDAPASRSIYQEDDQEPRAELDVTSDNVEGSGSQPVAGEVREAATDNAGETLVDAEPPTQSRGEAGAPTPPTSNLQNPDSATPAHQQVNGGLNQHFDPQIAGMLAMLQGPLLHARDDPNTPPGLAAAMETLLGLSGELAQGARSEQEEIAFASRVTDSLDQMFQTLNTPSLPPPVRALLGSGQNMIRGVQNLMTATSEAMGDGGDEQATAERREERVREAENEFLGVFTRSMVPVVDFSEQMVLNLQRQILGSAVDSSSSRNDDQLNEFEQDLFAMVDKRVTGEVTSWQAYLVNVGRGPMCERAWNPVYLLSCDKLYSVVEKDSEAHRANPMAPVFDTSATTGFTKIKAVILLNNANDEQPSEESPTFEIRTVSSGSLFYLEKLSRLQNWGESVLFEDKLANYYDEGSVKAVLACHSWPSFLQDVFTRPRPGHWPSLEALETIRANPPMLEPLERHVPEGETWQFAFYNQMIYLLSQVPVSAAYAFDAFKRVSFATTDTVPYTMLVNVLFMWLEQKWTPDMEGIAGVGPCFIGLFDALLEALESQSVPHFFIPQFNLVGEVNEMRLRFSHRKLLTVRHSLKDLDWVKHFSSADQTEGREENIAKVIEVEAGELFEEYLEWIYPKTNPRDSTADGLQAMKALKALRSLCSAAEAIRVLTTLDSFQCDDDTSLFTLVERIGCHCFQQRSTFSSLGTTRDLWQNLGEELFSILMRQEYPSPGLIVEKANILISLQKYEEAANLIPAVTDTMATQVIDSLLATWSNWYDATLRGLLDDDIASLLPRWTSFRAPSLAMALYLRCRCLLAQGKSPRHEIRRLHEVVKKITHSTDERDKERLAASLKLFAFVVGHAGFPKSAMASHKAADTLALHIGLCVKDETLRTSVEQ